jgi:Ca2+-binding EF-hand superfamily protein
MIKRVDPQASGTFGLRQLEELIRDKEKETNPNAFKELVEALRVFDSDKDGLLSAEEFKHAMMTMGEKMQEYEIDEIVNDGELVQNKQIKIETFATLIMNRI